MNDSKPSGQQVVTQNQDPWSGQQPYLTKGFEQAESRILNKPGEYFPESTVVPFDSRTTQGLGMIENRALRGSDALRNSNANVAATAGGGFLNSNPYLQGAVDNASEGVIRNYQKAIMPGLDSRFSASGRYGSGLHKSAMDDSQEILSDQLGDIASNMAFGNYSNERDRMLSASSLSPQMAAADYMDAEQMRGVGQAYEQQQGAQLQDDINRFYHDQDAEKKALADYMSLVAGGSFGSSTTTSQPIYSNKLGQGLGAAATLAGIGAAGFGPGFLKGMF